MTAIRPNAIWAFDFLFDHCANGQKLKCVAIKDEHTRESLAIEVHARFRSGDVLHILERLVACYGRPAFSHCDNGPEFVALAVKRWAAEHGIDLAYTQPSKPWQNGSIESFNSQFRDECLDREWFASRHEARVIIEQWRVFYNEERSHSAIAYRCPAELRRCAENGCQTPTGAGIATAA